MKLWGLGIALSVLFSVPVLGAEGSCGDEGLVCGEEESCCEHFIAMFAGDVPAAPMYVQGKCVPKGQRCRDFWCGNKHCEAGFFGTPTVCCVNTPANAVPEYSCARSELSCPGNNKALTIRNSSSERDLQGI